jgi:hypothetical protein
MKKDTGVSRTLFLLSNSIVAIWRGVHRQNLGNYFLWRFNGLQGKWGKWGVDMNSCELRARNFYKFCCRNETRWKCGHWQLEKLRKKSICRGSATTETKALVYFRRVTRPLRQAQGRL